jgi:hypothetical protein
MKVTFGLVNFSSPIVQRLERDILPTIAHYPEGEFEILCIDNDAVPSRDLLDCLGRISTPVKYLWNGGANVKIAAAKNQIYANAAHPVVVYVCANHGKMFDPTWVEDLIRPLEQPGVALAGTLTPYKLADIGEGPGTGKFVQGGVLGVRVEILRKHPLSSSYPHGASDKWISRNLVKNGYKLADVASVKSVWQRPMPAQHPFKYIHAEE